MNKINVLEGEWLGDDYYKIIYPRLKQAKISTFKYKIIPLLRLHDDIYWNELRKNPNVDFAVVDSHLWHYDDSTFNKYVQLFSSVNFPIVCVADSLCNAIVDIDAESYFKKFFERTEIICKIVRKNHPKTIILSPPINVVKSQHLNYCVDYFIHNREYFDGYAVHCVNDTQEHTLGKLASLLNQVMKILPKPLWITKWAVPSFEGELRTDKIIGSSSWEPWNYRAASLRMLRSFTYINSIATHGSKWFYAGMGKDLYSSQYSPGFHEFWFSKVICSRPSYTYEWDFSHFLGIMTELDIKRSILDSFINFVKKNNV